MLRIENCRELYHFFRHNLKMNARQYPSNNMLCMHWYFSLFYYNFFFVSLVCSIFAFIYISIYIWNTDIEQLTLIPVRILLILKMLIVRRGLMFVRVDTWRHLRSIHLRLTMKLVSSNIIEHHTWIREHTNILRYIYICRIHIVLVVRALAMWDWKATNKMNIRKIK